MEDASYFYEKARQCRRLLTAQLDSQTCTGLETLAKEFEAKADAAVAQAKSAALLGGEEAPLMPLVESTEVHDCPPA